MTDEIIWKGRPSQMLNFAPFLLAVLVMIGAGVGAMFVPLVGLFALPALLWALWKFFEVRCRVYELSAQRLRMYEGVLNQRIDELELYRVKDITTERPFWLRLMGLSTVVLMTSDRTHPELKIEAVKGAAELRENLRERVEDLRERKRVREMDFTSDGSDGDEFDGDL